VLRPFPQASPSQRLPRPSAKLGDPITLVAREYRSPELWFGDEDWGAGVDCWAAGVLMLGAFGFRPSFMDFGARSFADVADAFGWPRDDYNARLPGFPVGMCGAARPPWTPTLQFRAQPRGVALLDGLLANDPRERLTMARAVTHAYFDPNTFPLGGEIIEEITDAGAHDQDSCIGGYGIAPTRPATDREKAAFAGIRHPWNTHVGMMAPEVLTWVRDDPALAVVRVRWAGRGQNWKTEENRKMLISGRTEESKASSMCGLSLAGALPAVRFAAYVRAFRVVNEPVFVETHRGVLDEVPWLPAEVLDHLNARVLLNTPFKEWFLVPGELHVTDPGDELRTFWREPRHRDGAGSALHWSATLFGRRDTVFEQGPGLHDVLVRSQPGTVYFGQFTGAWHRVHHRACGGHELLAAGGRQVAVTLQCRTSLFPQRFSRQRDGNPQPPELFDMFARRWRLALAHATLRLPTLAECQAQLTER